MRYESSKARVNMLEGTVEMCILSLDVTRNEQSCGSIYIYIYVRVHSNWFSLYYLPT